MIETKVCTNCGVEKPISEFYKNKNIRDGFTCWCKKCDSDSHKKYRKNNKEIIKIGKKNIIKKIKKQ
jgi:hypothetical protein